ncbi:MAG: class I SAM-dependent methyltransferase [bacterium]
MNGLTETVEPVRRLNLWGRIVMRFAGRSVVAKHNRRSRLFYNAISRLYDWLYLVRVYGYVQSARHLVEETVEEDDLVMDLGCGTGLVTHIAAQRAREVVGIDQAKGMLLRAKRKGRYLDNVRYVLGDCRALPISGAFDVILSSFMLVILKEHERQGVIREAYRLLRPGGRLGLLGSQDRMSDEWYTSSGWRNLLDRAGFEDVKVIDLNGIFRIVLARRPPD